MDLTAIIKLLKDNPELLDKLLPIITQLLEKTLSEGIKRLVDGILAKV